MRSVTHQAEKVIQSLCQSIKLYSQPGKYNSNRVNEWPELLDHHLMANINLLEDMRNALADLTNLAMQELMRPVSAVVPTSLDSPIKTRSPARRERMRAAVEELEHVTEVALPWVKQEESLGNYL